MGLAPTIGSNYDIPLADHQDYRKQFASNSPSQRSEKEEFQEIFSELMTGTEHEIAFLTRHFAEVLGPWYACDHDSSLCLDADENIGWTYLTL